MSDGRDVDVDVVVVGAGVSGLLTALELRAEGFSVAIVEIDGVGAAQSNHSHGYLHRGYAYPGAAPALVDDLNRGADRWHSILADAGLSPVRSTGTVAFRSRSVARDVTRGWARAGLPADRADPPESFTRAGFVRCFRTEEPSYDFTPWLRAAAAELAVDVPIIAADDVVCHGGPGGVTDLVVTDGGRSRCRVVAGHYVFAAGTGNLPLSRALCGSPARHRHRLSFMVVLEGEVPCLSLVVPEHRSHGLFLVGRRTDRANAWLASNYFSYGGTACAPHATARWLRGVLGSLGELTALADPDEAAWAVDRWRVYTAPKAEMGRTAHVVGESAIDDQGLANAVFVSPSKLTLAPILAERVCDHVASRLVPTGARRVGAPSRSVPVRPERWTLTASRPGDELRVALLGDHPVRGIQALVDRDPS